MIRLSLPLDDAALLALHCGDAVLLSGVLVTGRDAAHRWLTDTFIERTRPPGQDDLQAEAALRPLLRGGVIYHCGPVTARDAAGDWRVLAAGPTTSSRQEPYQAGVIGEFGLKGVIGKGGMGAATLQACRQAPAAYFHAVGGAAVKIAACVRRVLGVHRLDFGAPEALWVLEVQDLPVVVSMDAHGASLHAGVRRRSLQELRRLLGVPGLEE